MINRTKLVQAFALYSLRSSRGQGLISRVSDPITALLQGGVYLFALRGLGFDIPMWVVPYAIPFIFICRYILGWLDEIRFGFWKAENHYVSDELNPFNQKVMNKLDKIIACLEKNDTSSRK